MPGTRVLVPEGVDAIGSWYQPYLHSSSTTFNQSRKNYYSDFNLIAEIKKAEEIATKIFALLKAFYGKREVEIADFLGVSHDDMKKDGFIKKLFDNLESDIAGESGSFPRLAKVGKTLKKSEEEKDKIIKDYKKKAGPVLTEYWNKGLEKYKIDRKKLTTTERKAMADRAKDTLIISHEVSADIKDILKEKGLSFPDEVIRAFALNVVAGRPIPKSLKKQVAQLEDALGEQLTQLKQFRRNAPGQTKPVVSTKASKNYGKIKTKNKLSGMIQNPLGNMSEDVIVYQLNRKTGQGMSNTFNFLLNTGSSKKKGVIFTIIAEDVGTKQSRKANASESEVFVDDVRITIVNEFTGEKMVIGIDAKKYYENESSKEYKYGRGGIVKKPFELTPNIISLEKFSTMLYLIANSYFYQRSTFDQLLGEPGNGTVGELYKVINWLRGIYGLLPASPIDFSSVNTYDNVGDYIKQDTRTFVILNDKLLLMTDFLDKVGDQAVQGEKFRNTVIRLSKNLTTILDDFDNSHSLKINLKKSKKDFLKGRGAPKFWEQSSADALSYYNQLHEEFIAPKLGKAIENQWKYQIKTEFIVR